MQYYVAILHMYVVKWGSKIKSLDRAMFLIAHNTRLQRLQRENSSHTILRRKKIKTEKGKSPRNKRAERRGNGERRRRL